MDLKVLAGESNPRLASALLRALQREPGERILARFPDGEIHIEIEEHVRGADVYLLQSTSAPVAEHLLELLLLSDACRRLGAARITAVLPYFGYARQDRRAGGREPLGARLVADLIEAGGIERVLVVDLHSAAVEGFFRIPLEHLSAVPLLAENLRPLLENAVIVSPDLGAVKLAEQYAQRLSLPVAVVHKVRLSGREVSAQRLVGEVQGRRPIMIDDMISTGGTIEAAARLLLRAGCLPEITVVASHALFVGPAQERLSSLPIERLITTDSVVSRATFPFPIEAPSLAPLLADTIQQLHAEQSLHKITLRTRAHPEPTAPPPGAE